MYWILNYCMFSVTATYGQVILAELGENAQRLKVIFVNQGT